MFLVTWLCLQYYNTNSKSAKIFHFSQFPHKRLHLRHLILKAFALHTDKACNTLGKCREIRMKKHSCQNYFSVQK
jgi:hypothetical protein